MHTVNPSFAHLYSLLSLLFLLSIFRFSLSPTALCSSPSSSVRERSGRPVSLYCWIFYVFAFIYLVLFFSFFPFIFLPLVQVLITCGPTHCLHCRGFPRNPFTGLTSFVPPAPTRVFADLSRQLQINCLGLQADTLKFLHVCPFFLSRHKRWIASKDSDNCLYFVQLLSPWPCDCPASWRLQVASFHCLLF